MRFSDAKGHKVVSSSTATTVGKVKSFVVDPATRSVHALRLRKTQDGSVLLWSAMTAFGTDAVTVTSADVIVEHDESVDALTGKEHDVLGKRVLTSAGEELGEVRDVDFDLETGAVVALVLKDADDVPGSRLVGVGGYAVVVRADQD